MSQSIVAIIPTLNRSALLEQCLRALLHQTRPLDEIVVVDNGSSDDTIGMVRQKHAGSVRLLQNAQNVGSTGAFCQGLMLSYVTGYDWFWLLDDDCMPQPDALERLWERGAAQPNALYGPRILDPQTGDPLWYRWGQATEGIVKVQSLALGGLLLSREVVQSVGYPLRDLWIYADDVEYCLRAKGKGFSSFVVYDSIVAHPAPSFFRWGKIAGRSLLAFPKYRSPDRAYYDIRNWTFVIARYWNLFSPLVLLGQLRNMICLALSGTVPFRLTLRAVRDGLGLQASLK